MCTLTFKTSRQLTRHCVSSDHLTGMENILHPYCHLCKHKVVLPRSEKQFKNHMHKMHGFTETSLASNSAQQRDVSSECDDAEVATTNLQYCVMVNNENAIEAPIIQDSLDEQSYSESFTNPSNLLTDLQEHGGEEKEDNDCFEEERFTASSFMDSEDNEDEERNHKGVGGYVFDEETFTVSGFMGFDDELNF